MTAQALSQLAIAKTVLLELERVLRGYYKRSTVETEPVLQHLISRPQVELEDRPTVERAIGSHAAGLVFADALRHASNVGARQGV